MKRFRSEVELNQHDLRGKAEQLAAAVREAGQLALSMFGKPVKTWTKGEAQSPVSEADIAADNLLRERLGTISPDIAWLSEESVDDAARLEARHVWVVDPIDGTRAYIGGLPDWAVSVALVEDARPVLACLYAPALDEFFAARAGGGATRNGAPIAASRGSGIENARIAGPRKLMERLAAIAPPFATMPRGHSLALRLTRVAQGIFDAAIAGGSSHDWDLAAADLLVHEAGGTLAPVGGGSVTYNRPVPRHGTLVAAGRDRHAALMRLLRDERLASS
ncbi:MAG TPA: 3'(2'),5'-bisphosphate nucleotidase CysQ [Xanthobacteraceae bacterium]|jgi:myo-inositol-1(or 4)-monophosphatase|nr:3'(2'),5'-bisphosphate nucleotidase CysQ [Xanthobacteraceae bacterium]